MGLNTQFYHQTVTTEQVENYISLRANFGFQKVFDQYLRDIRIPILEYSIMNNVLKYRWANTIDGFNMPIEVSIDNNKQWLYPENSWKEAAIKQEFIEIDKDYYVFNKDLRIIE